MGNVIVFGHCYLPPFYIFSEALPSPGKSASGPFLSFSRCLKLFQPPTARDRNNPVQFRGKVVLTGYIGQAAAF
jgi:hypothetical protein